MSVNRDWRLRVQDIIDYAASIVNMTGGMDYETFVANQTVQLAVTRCLEVIGEAARHVPPEVQARCPEVAWRLMNDMRNVLIHAYASVDLGLVWEAATVDVPPTRERLVRFLEEERSADT
jgi:uncharacterized protein with HEPN domain